MGLKKRLQLLAVIAVATILSVTPLTAMASGQIENRSDASVTIGYKDRSGQAINGMRVRLYKVADVKGETVAGAVNGYDASYTLTSAFRQFDEETGTNRITGFSEKSLNDALIVRVGETDTARRARWQGIARTLETYAIADVAATATTSTTDGRAVFTGLTPGLYLLVADGIDVHADDADYRYVYQPTFVMLPAYENGLWDYSREFSFEENGDAVLRQKYSYVRIPYRYEVVKRWYNDNTSVRPREVRIDIYKDGVFYRTVYLNESNNWRYEWEGGKFDFTVVERETGNNYTVRIDSSKEGTFTVENTYNPPDNPPPPTEVPPPEEVLGVRRLPPTEEPAVLGSRRLPQTGQLNWPVPVLAVTGMMLFAIGFVRNRRNA